MLPIAQSSTVFKYSLWPWVNFSICSHTLREALCCDFCLKSSARGFFFPPSFASHHKGGKNPLWNRLDVRRTFLQPKLGSFTAYHRLLNRLYFQMETNENYITAPWQEGKNSSFYYLSCINLVHAVSHYCGCTQFRFEQCWSGKVLASQTAGITFTKPVSRSFSNTMPTCQVKLQGCRDVPHD